MNNPNKLNNLTSEQQDELVGYVVLACETHPHLVPRIINAATEGVKRFARNQRSLSSDYAVRLADMLDATESK